MTVIVPTSQPNNQTNPSGHGWPFSVNRPRLRGKPVTAKSNATSTSQRPTTALRLNDRSEIRSQGLMTCPISMRLRRCDWLRLATCDLRLATCDVGRCDCRLRSQSSSGRSLSERARLCDAAAARRRPCVPACMAPPQG